MTQYLPDEVPELLANYLATLVPQARYATWADAAWRHCLLPLHLQAQAAGAAPLAFSFKDDTHAVESIDQTSIIYRAGVTLQFLYPSRPANARNDWEASALAAHAALCHFLRPTSVFPFGLTVVPSKSIQIRRSLVAGDWILGELTFPVIFESPLTWS